MVESQFEVAVGTEQRHRLDLLHVVVALREFFDGIEVAFDLDDEVTPLPDFLEQGARDVGDQVVVVVDMDDDAFDEVVLDRSTEGDTLVKTFPLGADLRQRRSLGDHHGHLGETVAGAEGEEVRILLHVDIDRLLEVIVEDMAEDAVVRSDEILTLRLDHHMRVDIRLAAFHCDDVDGAFREALVTFAERETGLDDAEWRDVVGDVNDGGARHLRQNDSLDRRSIVVGGPPVARQRDYRHPVRIKNTFAKITLNLEKEKKQFITFAKNYEQKWLNRYSK